MIAIPSAIFVITSNVDGHFLKSGFTDCEIAQIHGTYTKWQCGGIPNYNKNDFKMFAKGRCCNKTWPAPDIGELKVDLATLRCQFPNGDSYPKCPECKVGINRPNIFLFGDTDFVEDPELIKKDQYSIWNKCVKDLLKSNPNIRIVILEIGCGLRVPSIRKRCEELFQCCPKGQAHFIRINPQYPDNKIIISPNIPIQATCLDALKQIDALLDK